MAFFKTIKIDRQYNRDEYIDEAVRYIEPLDLRDEFKEVLSQFNKSLSIVLPNTKALKFQSDFDLYNEIKLRARNVYPDDEELKISREESKMLQAMIDEHLTATGVKNLLEEPVSILDRKKFEKEIQNASPATKELKMRNNLKHVIKTGIDKNPDFFKPLAKRLEELLKQREQDRITQANLLLAFAEIQETIINAEKESEQQGFTSDAQKAVYQSMKIIFNGNAVQATKNFFDCIQGELNIVGWREKGQVQKDIENKIKGFFKTTLSRTEAKVKAIELLSILKSNKDA